MDDLEAAKQDILKRLQQAQTLNARERGNMRNDIKGELIASQDIVNVKINDMKLQQQQLLSPQCEAYMFLLSFSLFLFY